MNSGINPKENDYELAKSECSCYELPLSGMQYYVGGIFCGVFKG